MLFFAMLLLKQYVKKQEPLLQFAIQTNTPARIAGVFVCMKGLFFIKSLYASGWVAQYAQF